MALDKETMFELGIISKYSKFEKLKPNPKSIKPLKFLLKLLNKNFNKNESKIFYGNKFTAILPWGDNDEKEWILITDSLPALYSNKSTKIQNLMKVKYPFFQFKFSLSCSITQDQRNFNTKFN